jgi:hypothetical protein
LVSDATLAIQLDNGDGRIVRRTTTSPAMTIKPDRRGGHNSWIICRRSSGVKTLRISCL